MTLDDMPKTSIIRITTLLLAVLPFAKALGAAPSQLADLSLVHLEQRLSTIDLELGQLAQYSLRSGTGAIGYRSSHHDNEFHREWIRIDLGSTHPIDEVVLVPVIRRDTKTGFEADGFPKNFRLIAGTTDAPDGKLIAEYTDANTVLPRIAPLSIPCAGVNASWIQIEAERLSLRAFDERYVLQLAEIIVFSGRKNVALHKSVESRSNRHDGLAWDKRFIVDGFVPYLMDAATGEKSVAFIDRVDPNATPSLTIDLGAPTSISSLHLHAVEKSDFLPQALPSEFGIPRGMRLEGANRADFNDGETLLDVSLNTIFDMSTIMMWELPGSTHRYLRLNIIVPPDPISPSRPPRFGFAEIELFSHGKNVALGRTVTVTGTYSPRQFRRSVGLLTDGHNFYGTILPIREWMHQLARRHDLETERPHIETELNRRYLRQKANLRRMAWLSALLAAGIGLTILIDRVLRMRQIRRIKQRIAADLHDELGANLHTIGLLSDLAKEAVDSPEELNELLDRTRVFTERSGVAARYCTNILEAKGLCEDIVEEMKRAASRLLADLDYDLQFEGEDMLKRLRPRKRIDLFFFYKECLHNIIRHSGATRIDTRVTADPKRIRLTVTDNGHGLDGDVPTSLKRRARLLGAKLEAKPQEVEGTLITLTLKTRNYGIFR